MCVCVGLGVELSRKRPVLLVLGKRDGGLRPLLRKHRTASVAARLFVLLDSFGRLLKSFGGGRDGCIACCAFFAATWSTGRPLPVVAKAVRPRASSFRALASGLSLLSPMDGGRRRKRVLEVPRDLRRNGAYKVAISLNGVG